MENKILTKKPPILQSRYELKNGVRDYRIFENGNMMLILNDYMNAENILNILRSDEIHERYKFK